MPGNRYRQLLQNLGQLRTLGRPAPTMPTPAPVAAAAPPGRDVFLPPEGGLDPRLPIAHLPEPQRTQAVQGMMPGETGGINPALTDALEMLQGHQGRIGELLQDPTKHAQLRVALEAVKQDAPMLEKLAGIGIGPGQIQQFEQQLTAAVPPQVSRRGTAAPTAPPSTTPPGPSKSVTSAISHWLSG